MNIEVQLVDLRYLKRFELTIRSNLNNVERINIEFTWFHGNDCVRVVTKQYALDCKATCLTVSSTKIVIFD